MDEKQTMTVKEAAGLLGVHPQTVRYMIEKKLVPWGTAVRMKRTVFIIYRERFETETGIRTERSTK